MKSRVGVAVGRLIAAAIFLAAGLLLRNAADASRLVAAALEHLTTAPGSTNAELDQARDTLGLVGQVPVLGSALVRDIEHRRAEAAYWRGEYATVTAGVGDATADAADDAALASIHAAAMFRSLQGSPGNAATVRALDDVLARYGEILKMDPAQADAAYNYEVVSRVRDAAARGRAPSTDPDEQGTAQGDKGSPPPETQPADFNVIVPMRPDERQDQFDAGTGSTPLRKG
jgi:hypothetical protein